MKRPIGTRLAILVVAFLASLTFFLPSLPFEKPGWWAGVFPEKGVSLGLDLQGGIHLVLSVDTEKAVEASLVRDIRTVMKHAQIEQNVPKAHDSIIAVDFGSVEQAELILGSIPDSAPDLQADSDGSVLTFSYSDAVVRSIEQYSIRQAVETIRNRIDQFGVVEPSIQTQGDNKIVIQLPGVSDPQRAIELIGQTAVLEFRIVRNDAPSKEIQERISQTVELDPELESDLEGLRAAVADLIPAGAELLRFSQRDEFGTRESYIVVEDHAQLTGDVLANAGVRFDKQFNEPYVSLEFTSEGAKLFEDVTGENVGKQMAIVLDGVVRTAPNIRQKISGGRAQIDGIGNLDEAHDVAVVLRAGALPAPVNIDEERTVGPTLGQDSIRRGLTALAIGMSLVVAFMAVYYQIAGLFAVTALVVNIVAVLGILGLFHATLTLPGIAGIVLTVGMAVDANIIIFERIREELAAGRNVRSAVSTGFSKATWAILDANITTIIAALILFQFGSGPLKGFAVTLSVGVMTTLFAALFVTRLLFDIYLRNRSVSAIRI